MIKTAILTVSDSCAAGERRDESAQTIADMLPQSEFEICEKKVAPDDAEAIAADLRRFCDQIQADIVFTTGGTGFGPRDVTPEATQAVSEKLVPGIGEIMRAGGCEKTKRAVLSRGIAGIRKRTLIINLPGSPKGAAESLEIILDVLVHAVKMLHGGGH
ncbi:MAG TPA: MogA/MoaB family molybdenum cofactor biosynthesis protein [Planctomycetes bacterium]|nr:MogA/MoaB family molybdenum cofactor biosynthesis protein [Planctomycetota bacterium]HIJ71506.1 MogA/MoaB family molybdenum cofactor biosynthesis protein [Planctomycetota bacterium]